MGKTVQEDRIAELATQVDFALNESGSDSYRLPVESCDVGPLKRFFDEDVNYTGKYNSTVESSPGLKDGAGLAVMLKFDMIFTKK